MRRLLLIMAWLAAAVTAAAQVEPAQQLPDDSLYYDAAAEEVYQQPRINPIYYFGSPFCEHFSELRFLVGIEDMGLGFDYAYLPEVWGFHVSAIFGGYNEYFLAGADYRLSKPWDNADWHLYGSLGACLGNHGDYLRPALEVGLRAASPIQQGRFCFTSGTLGVLTTGDTWYLTIGCSLTISIMAAAGLMLAI